MFLSTYFPYWSRHETSEKNHTWPASIVIELPILGASNHANVWVFFQTKTAQKNFANAAFVPQNHMFFAKKNTINFECDTKKAHIHPPPPQQKNQNPCLTNKIRTTKKPPHLYIYIYTYISSLPWGEYKQLQAISHGPSFAGRKKDLPPPTPTASPPETMPPEVAASASASSSAASGAPRPKPARTPGVFLGGLGVPLVSGCFGLSFWSIPREGIHIKHLFLEKNHHLLQFLCLWGEGIC